MSEYGSLIKRKAQLIRSYTEHLNTVRVLAPKPNRTEQESRDLAFLENVMIPLYIEELAELDASIEMLEDLREHEAFHE